MPFGNNIINGYITKGAFWIRFFGYGFLVKDLRITRLTVAESETKNFIVLDWFVAWLEPGDNQI